MSDLTASTFTAAGTALFDAAINWAVGPGGAAASTITQVAMDAKTQPGSDQADQEPAGLARPGAVVAIVPEGSQLAVLQRSRKSRPLWRHCPSDAG